MGCMPAAKPINGKENRRPRFRGDGALLVFALGFGRTPLAPPLIPRRLLEEVPHRLVSGVAQLADGFRLDLADALSRDAEELPDFL